MHCLLRPVCPNDLGKYGASGVQLMGLLKVKIALMAYASSVDPDQQIEDDFLRNLI